MKKIIQAIMVVPIAETIGKAFGRNTLMGTGAAIVASRFVMRSFGGMLAVGILAGGLNYFQNKADEPTLNPTSPKKAAKKSGSSDDASGD